jgi:hypothetical protein
MPGADWRTVAVRRSVVLFGWTATTTLAACGQRLPTDAEAAAAIGSVQPHVRPGEWPYRVLKVRWGVIEQSRIDRLDRHSPLNSKVFDRRVRGAHSVESVYFEAFPDFFVTANLYRPVGRAGLHPAILLPHGHFHQDGYFARTMPSHQILAATLAEMGALVLAYDMVGWGDSRQLPHGTSQVLALQLWDSIRAVDFMAGLPDVDQRRIGVAGASGGGTQSFLLAAVDERVRAVGVVVMLSAAFPGGDICEIGMPIREVSGTNNAEIAAIIAPRPLLVVSDGRDWTRTVPRVEFPYLRSVYAMVGAPDAVENVHLEHEGHEEGPRQRMAVYEFFARRFGLARPSTEFSEIEPHDEMSFWTKVPAQMVAVPKVLVE